MATNPIPIVVPCHRVLRTGGNLGGYGGGLETKVRLLELESGSSSLF
jgi:methylated-DNA-[protein]-cysteine S-methyltransferase